MTPPSHPVSGWSAAKEEPFGMTIGAHRYTAVGAPLQLALLPSTNAPGYAPRMQLRPQSPLRDFALSSNASSSISLVIPGYSPLQPDRILGPSDRQLAKGCPISWGLKTKAPPASMGLPPTPSPPWRAAAATTDNHEDHAVLPAHQSKVWAATSHVLRHCKAGRLGDKAICDRL